MQDTAWGHELQCTNAFPLLIWHMSKKVSAGNCNISHLLWAPALGAQWGANQGQCAAQVRSKALIQYTAPFVSVDLRTMAAAFSADVECGAPPPKTVPLLILTACARRDLCL